MNEPYSQNKLNRKNKTLEDIEDEIISLDFQYGNTPEQTAALRSALRKAEDSVIRHEDINYIPSDFESIVSPIYTKQYEAKSKAYNNHSGIVDLANKVQTGRNFLDLAQKRYNDYEVLRNGTPIKLNKATINGSRIYAPTVARSDEGSYYSPSTNLINIEHNTLSAFPHELGHMASRAYGMQGNAVNADGVSYRKLYNKDEDLVRKYYDSKDSSLQSMINTNYEANRERIAQLLLEQRSDPWALYKANPAIFGLDDKFNRINAANHHVLQEEYRASELGARFLDGNKMSPADRYATTFKGTPSYLAQAADNLHIFSPDDIELMENAAAKKYADGRYSSDLVSKARDYMVYKGLKELDNVEPKRMPAPLPVYNYQDQARAIADFRQHELQRQQHPYVMKQWGNRPEGFENEGLWTPGMTPVTAVERRMHDYTYNNSPGRFNNVPYNKLSLLNTDFNTLRNGVSGNGASLSRTPEQRKYNELMNTRTWLGYDTIADRMGNLAHAYLSASSPEESKSNVLNLVNSRRPLYVTPETIRDDVRNSYYTAQGQYPGVSVPRDEIHPHLNRLVNTTQQNVNRQHDIAKVYGKRKGAGNNAELASNRFTKPIYTAGYHPYTPAHRPASSKPPYRNPSAPNLPSLSNMRYSQSSYYPGRANGVPSMPNSNNSFNNSTSTLSAYRHK